MKYITYREEENIVKYSKYMKMKTSILRELPKIKAAEESIRRLRFMNPHEYNYIQEAEQAKYYISMHNGDMQQIFIESESIQDDITYKASTRINYDEYEKIINNDIEWMQNHKDQIIADFYLQITINAVTPAYITEYEREIYNFSKKEKVIFNKKISRAAGKNINLLDENMLMINCLSEDKVSYSFIRKTNIPSVVFNIMNNSEEVAGGLCFQ